MTINCLDIQDAAAGVTLAGDIEAASTIDIVSSGYIDQAARITAAAGLDYDAGSTIAINDSITVSGTVDIDSGGVTTLAAAADISAGGAVTFGSDKTGTLTTSGDIDTTDDNITFTRAVTLGGDVDIDTGAGAGNITFQSTLEGTTDFSEDLSLTAGTGNIYLIDIVGGTKNLGDITINNADDVQIQASINANNIAMTASDTTIDIDDDVTAAADIELNNNTAVADGVTLTAGNNIKLGAGKTMTGEGDLTLVATAGGISEKAGDDGKFQINMAADDKTLTLTQNDTLDITNFSVTNDEDTYLIATSTAGTITSTTAGAWKSISANAWGDLILTNLNNNDAITIGNLISGGEIWVQSVADFITQADVTLAANGTYSATINDDRSRVYFQTDSDPVDVAIYLASYDFTTQTGGNVTVNSAVSMTNNGTMVIDAYDTVNTFGSNFTGSSAWSNKTNRLEVVSRISQSLEDAINSNRIPYAREARMGATPFWFGGEKYVLRGRGLLAEVLAAVGAVPTVPNISFTPESSIEVTLTQLEINKDFVMRWLAEELGEETIRMYLQNTYLYSTDLQPYKVAERLINLAAILTDVNPKLSVSDKVMSPVPSIKVGLSISTILPVLWRVTVPAPAPVLISTEPSGAAALVAAVGEFIKEPPPSKKQIAFIKSSLLQHRGDGSHYDRAGEWLDALATYVSILNTEFGWSSERSFRFVMAKYGSELDTTSAMFVEMYLLSSAFNRM